MENNKRNLPAKFETLLPCDPERLEVLKSSSAVQALNSFEPNVRKIREEYGDLFLCKGLTYLINKLFKVRHSKKDLSPELVDEFKDWLLSTYHWLNLQELELAFVDYRGNTFHVIDLEILKIMVEEYDKKRAKAVEDSREEEIDPSKELYFMKRKYNDLTREQRNTKAGQDLRKDIFKTEREVLDNKAKYKTPDHIKELGRKLSVDNPERIKSEPRPKNLEELFEKQGVKEPEKMAKEIREQWIGEFKTILEEAKKLEIRYKESSLVFMQKKESYFITSQTRRLPLNKKL